MIVKVRRAAAAVSLRVAFTAALAALTFSLGVHGAQAVVVRGTVTDPLGAVVPNAHVQLIQGQTSVASVVANPDGTFEIRSQGAGRYLLLTSAPTFAPAVGDDFYGGPTDLITRTVVLEPATVTEQITVTATGTPTPLQQLSSPVTLIPMTDLATRIGILDDLRQSPGADVVQTGQAGGATSLFVRGGNSDANKVLIDGIPAEDVGGRFDFGTVSSTGLAGLEFYRGPNSALYGSDAVASVVNLNTPRGATVRPVLVYSGDAGNLHTFRNEATLSGTRSKLDYFGAFSRFDTSNAVRDDKYHAATSAANLGYALTANTLARFTLRYAVSASGLPNAHDFFGISAHGREGDQDLYSGATLENTRAGRWHNLVRYGVARKREQGIVYEPVGEAMDDGFGDITYYGKAVTIHGANGYTATGRASIAFGGKYPQRQDSVSNRDELYFQSDYAFTRHLTGLFGFRYDEERGRFVFPTFGLNQKLKRTNFDYTVQLQGDVRNRLFYSLGGGLVKNHLSGLDATPRIGLAYAVVRPADGFFHGTRLRANFAKGVQEPSLSVESTSLYGVLTTAGNTAAIAKYGIRPVGAQKSRSFDFGLDQNVIGQRVIVKLGYFHNQYDHQIEYVDSGTLGKNFGLKGLGKNFYGADLNSLAFRAQGFEGEVQAQLAPRLFVRGGYTYLGAVVRQSFSTDAVNAGSATTNPNLPGVAIGSSSPLVGARPFRRPPHTGFFALQYTGEKFSAAFKGAMASRSDDSTFLAFSDLNFDNTLLLPNRNLDFGYAKLDAYGMYAFTRHITGFGEVDNLLNQQHIGPIGYPGLPLTFRSGLKLRLGGE